MMIYQSFMLEAPLGKKEETKISLFKQALNYAKDHCLKVSTVSTTSVPVTVATEILVMRVAYTK